MTGITDSAVWKRLRSDYPPEVLQWVRGLEWQRRDVPLNQILLQPRPGAPLDHGKIRGIMAARKAGTLEAKPVTLVDTGRGKLKIADGYHRLAVAAILGDRSHDALVAEHPARVGPWSRAMHDAKLNV